MSRTWAIVAYSALAFVLRVDAEPWDRDTLAGEAKGRLDVVTTALGASDSNTRRYYEMRVERLAKELAQTSAPDAALLDDLAAALDRLDRSDEAIGVMAQKPAAIARLASPASRDNHEYRRLANLGTFYAHRWMRSSDRRGTLDDLHHAASLIGEAVKLDPNAHFGRERYQLMYLQWLLDAYEHPLVASSTSGRTVRKETFEPTFVGGTDALRNPDDVARGICGLIRLGTAWESIDTFQALAEAVYKSQAGAVGFLVDQRIAELREKGGQSLNPLVAELDAPGNDAARVVGRISRHPVPEPRAQARIREYFLASRRVADENQTAREAFMNRQFDLGRHPDTYADFWRGVPAMRARPVMPDNTWLERLAPRRDVAWYLVLIGGGLLIPAAIWLRRRRQRSASWEDRFLSPPGQEALQAGPKPSR